MNLSIANIFSGLLFGTIGFAAFMYGKKQGAWRPMALGGALMVFPYIISNTVWQYIIGIFLTAVLFVFR